MHVKPQLYPYSRIFKKIHMFDYILNLDGDTNKFLSKYARVIPKTISKRIMGGILNENTDKIRNYVNNSLREQSWGRTTEDLFKSLDKSLQTQQSREYIENLRTQPQKSLQQTYLNEIIKQNPKIETTTDIVPNYQPSYAPTLKHNLDLELVDILMQAKENRQTYNKII